IHYLTDILQSAKSSNSITRTSTRSINVIYQNLMTLTVPSKHQQVFVVTSIKSLEDLITIFHSESNTLNDSDTLQIALLSQNYTNSLIISYMLLFGISRLRNRISHSSSTISTKFLNDSVHILDDNLVLLIVIVNYQLVISLVATNIIKFLEFLLQVILSKHTNLHIKDIVCLVVSKFPTFHQRFLSTRLVFICNESSNFT